MARKYAWLLTLIVRSFVGLERNEAPGPKRRGLGLVQRIIRPGPRANVPVSWPLRPNSPVLIGRCGIAWAALATRDGPHDVVGKIVTEI